MLHLCTTFRDKVISRGGGVNFWDTFERNYYSNIFRTSETIQPFSKPSQVKSCVISRAQWLVFRLFLDQFGSVKACHTKPFSKLFLTDLFINLPPRWYTKLDHIIRKNGNSNKLKKIQCCIYYWNGAYSVGGIEEAVFNKWQHPLILKTLTDRNRCFWNKINDF